ncbi:MAG TPA: 3-isopropylmalate dehydratase, partial [Polyangiaceae bacterium]|nr:3-isopropylmalate dehydratase [Polyangiaceae bacterium]
MTQKVLAPRAKGGGSLEAAEHVEVDVDQVALVRAPAQALGAAVAAGLKKTSVEVAVAYDGTCITMAPPVAGGAAARAAGLTSETRAVASDLLARGVLVARAGVGFPAPVHLERFASPA